MAKIEHIKNKRHEIIHPITEVVAVEGLSEALAEKQETLVSGENIRKINGESILGSGEIKITGGGPGSTVIIDGEISAESENPVQNKVITQALASKQDELESGVNIKTVNGESIMGEGDLFIREGDPFTVKFAPQELTEEQKAQARANINAASLEDINNMDFVTAASLPTASESTMGHIYLIGPDVNNNYDRYFTQESGGAYSWVSLGSTQIDLSDCATKTEVSQLEDEIGNKSGAEVRVNLETDEWTSGYAMVSDVGNANFGKRSTYSACSASGYIDISRFAGKVMTYLRMTVSSATSSYGMVFYSDIGVEFAISGQSFLTGQAEIGTVLTDITIPSNAKYVRFTCWTEYLENWQAYVDTIEYTYTSGIGKSVQDLDVDMPVVKSNLGYYVCNTGAATAAKTVSAPGYALFVGGGIRIKFNYNNSASGDITLNINGTGAKPLVYNKAAVSSSNSWATGEVVDVFYDGTSFQAYSHETVDNLTTGGRRPLAAEQGKLLSWVNREPTRKVIYPNYGASYQKGANNFKITLDFVSYYDNKTGAFITAYADGNSSSHQPKTFTLNTNNRVLVIASDSIVLRASNAQVLDTDIILLSVASSDGSYVLGGELVPWLSRDFAWVNNEPTRKIIYSDAVFQKGTTNFKVIVDYVSYYDNKTGGYIVVYADGDSSSHQAKTFTLNQSNGRHLVITADGTIAYRVNNTQIQVTDIILLSVSSSDYTKVWGGALYSQYCESLVGGLQEQYNGVSWVNNEPTRKVLFSNGTAYKRNSNSVDVTIDYVGYYDNKTKAFVGVYADGDASSHQPKTFRLNQSNGRYLVITSSSTIAIRYSNAQVLSTDIVLLSVSSSDYSRVICGELFTDYVNKVNEDAWDGELAQKDGFATAPEYFAWKKAEQFTKLKWTPLKDTIQKASNETFFSANVEQTGMPYSSVAEYDKRVGYDVSLHTFMTAIHNPYSLMYTECVRYGYSRSAYGRTYYGPNNSGPFYGMVCSVFTGHALGIPIPYVTGRFADLAQEGVIMEKVYDQSANGVRRGDLIWNPGHIQIVKDVWRRKGVVTKIIISEEAQPIAHDRAAMTADEFNTYMSGKILYRYKDLYKNIHYAQSPFVTVDDEIPMEFTYNDDICTFAGDKAAFAEGELIYIHCLNLNYPQMELYKDDVLVETITLASDSRAALTSDNLAYAVNLSNDNLSYGKYKCRLKNGSTYSDYTYFEVLDVNLEISGDTASYSSANANALYWYWNEYHEPDGAGIYRQTPLPEGSSGEFDCSDRKEGYPLLKVIFAGDYGCVAASVLEDRS